MAGPGENGIVRPLAYVLPTVYLVVVFTIFQVINIQSVRKDTDAPAFAAPNAAFVLTLPWSALGMSLTSPLNYLPMVVGAPLNAGIAYFLLRRRWR